MAAVTFRDRRNSRSIISFWEKDGQRKEKEQWKDEYEEENRVHKGKNGRQKEEEQST